MGKEKKKTKKKCCGKYLKSGRHCKNCPLLNRGGIDAKGKKAERKKDKDRKGEKKK